jgi:hypothetical protein
MVCNISYSAIPPDPIKKRENRSQSPPFEGRFRGIETFARLFRHPLILLAAVSTARNF